jgi:hypothetical protein
MMSGVETGERMSSARDDSSVQVVVRIRPLSAREDGCDDCIRVLHQSSSSHPCALQIGGSQGPSFTFDHVFGADTEQRDIYDTRVQALVDSCLEGYNATILAYGEYSTVMDGRWKEVRIIKP